MDKQSKESDNKLSQLTHIFPFLFSQQGINNDTTPQNEEFQKMVADIAKNKNSNEYLKGEANIVESMIVKYGKIKIIFLVMEFIFLKKAIKHYLLL